MIVCNDVIQNSSKVCNGHGECVYEGCICDDGWEGDDCQYRISCLEEGSIVFNYTLKGDDCEIGYPNNLYCRQSRHQL